MQNINRISKINKVGFWSRYPGLVAIFTTKPLGNMSFRAGQRRKIRKNRHMLMKELGMSWKDVLIIPVTHSNKVLSLPSSARLKRNSGSLYISGGKIWRKEKPLFRNKDYQEGIDAVVTNKTGIFPVIMPADCASVGFFDPKKKVVALAHAGIIGAINKIVFQTLECMKKDFNCKAADIETVIFPSIRKCHYDISNSGAWKKIGPSVASYFKKSKVLKDNYFDLPLLIKTQLLEFGVRKNKIHDTGLCTICNSKYFFSNYAAKGKEGKAKEGRFITLLGMKAW